MNKLSAFSLFLGTMVFSFFAMATTSGLTLTDARIFAPIKGSNTTAGYAKLLNSSDSAIKVSIVKVSPFKAVELHETVPVDGRMAMQKVEEYNIPAKGSLELKPGGHHLMLFDATRGLNLDETLKVTLKVNGKEQDFDFKVVPRMASSHKH